MKNRQFAIIFATMNSIAAFAAPGGQAAGTDSLDPAARAVNALG
jgi:hypothetical protein